MTTTTQLRRIKRRLLVLYKENRRNGGWRTVGEMVGVNWGVAYRVAHGGPFPENVRDQDRLLALVTEAKDMNQEQAKLVYIMQHYHHGQDSAILLPDLLTEMYGGQAAADRSKNNRWDRELRAMIVEINHDHGGMICSDPYHGYWWAATLEEGLAVVGAAYKRAHSIEDNARHLEANLKNTFGGQLGLLP